MFTSHQNFNSEGLYIKHHHGKKASVVKVQEGANNSFWAFQFCFSWLWLWLSFAEICRMNIAWPGRGARRKPSPVRCVLSKQQPHQKSRVHQLSFNVSSQADKYRHQTPGPFMTHKSQVSAFHGDSCLLSEQLDQEQRSNISGHLETQGDALMAQGRATNFSLQLHD